MAFDIFHVPSTLTFPLVSIASKLYTTTSRLADRSLRLPINASERVQIGSRSKPRFYCYTRTSRSDVPETTENCLLGQYNLLLNASCGNEPYGGVVLRRLHLFDKTHEPSPPSTRSKGFFIYSDLHRWKKLISGQDSFAGCREGLYDVKHYRSI
jgi:hypothetical protein